MHMHKGDQIVNIHTGRVAVITDVEAVADAPGGRVFVLDSRDRWNAPLLQSNWTKELGELQFGAGR